MSHCTVLKAAVEEVWRRPRRPSAATCGTSEGLCGGAPRGTVTSPMRTVPRGGAVDVARSRRHGPRSLIKPAILSARAALPTERPRDPETHLEYLYLREIFRNGKWSRPRRSISRRRRPTDRSPLARRANRERCAGHPDPSMGPRRGAGDASLGPASVQHVVVCSRLLMPDVTQRRVHHLGHEAPPVALPPLQLDHTLGPAHLGRLVRWAQPMTLLAGRAHE
jgi:hypothetical protein